MCVRMWSRTSETPLAKEPPGTTKLLQQSTSTAERATRKQSTALFYSSRPRTKYFDEPRLNESHANSAHPFSASERSASLAKDSASASNTSSRQSSFSGSTLTPTTQEMLASTKNAPAERVEPNTRSGGEKNTKKQRKPQIPTFLSTRKQRPLSTNVSNVVASQATSLPGKLASSSSYLSSSFPSAYTNTSTSIQFTSHGIDIQKRLEQAGLTDDTASEPIVQRSSAKTTSTATEDRMLDPISRTSDLSRNGDPTYISDSANTESSSKPLKSEHHFATPQTHTNYTNHLYLRYSPNHEPRDGHESTQKTRWLTGQENIGTSRNGAYHHGNLSQDVSHRFVRRSDHRMFLDLTSSILKNTGTRWRSIQNSTR